MHSWVAIFLFLFSFLSFSKVQTWEYVRAPKQLLTPEIIERLGIIEDHGFHKEFVMLYVPQENLHLFQKQMSGYAISVKPLQVAKGKINLQNLQDNLLNLENAASLTEPYHTYDSLTQELQTLTASNSHILSLESVGKTVQNREIWLTRFTDKTHPDTHRPKLLLVSSMHGDEVTGKEVLIYFIRYLLAEHKNNNARIVNLLKHAEIFIIPSMNPDGTELEQRFNANGKDLNRNFSNRWDARVRGNEEPETQALIRLHENHHFVTSMNFHGGELCLNIPWDHRPNSDPNLRFGDDKAMQHLAQTYVKNNLPMFQHSEGEFHQGIIYGYEWFRVLGGMQDWSNIFHDSIHSTLEISEVKWPPAAELPNFWNDNRESILQFLEESTLGIHLEIVDPLGNPLNSEISINTSTRTIRFKSGIVHRATTPEPQTVLIESGMWAPQSIQVLPTHYNGSLQKTVMQEYERE